jgi:lambda family phage portal protein
MKANWIDRAVTFFDPQGGLRRLRARAAADHILRYEGARHGRRTDGWLAQNTSANAEIGPALSFLRARSRDLVRNDPYAKKAVRVLVTNIVGRHGLTPRASTGDKALDQMIDAAFSIWRRECDADRQLTFGGLQRLIQRSTIESGEVLIRRRARRAQDGLHVPLQLQVLEADYLDSNRQWFPNEFNGPTIAGVAFDPLGDRSAYWMFPWHPGDVIKYVKDGFVSKLIPADQITHLYEKDRPGQVRGTPWLSAVVMTLKDLGDYDEAERVRKKVEACLSVFVTQAEGSDGTGIAPQTTDTNSGARIETVEPGMVEYLKPGEDIKTAAPASTGGYGEYLSKQEHKVAAGSDVMYEQMTGDLSQVNYSSYRAGNIEFRAFVEQYRELTFIPMCCDPLWMWFIDAAFLSGKIPAREYGVKWTSPAWQSVDPEKDEMADLIAVRRGSKTWGMSVIEDGGDPVEQLAAIARQNKEFDDAGVVLDIDPRRVDRARGANQIRENEDVGENNAGKGSAKPAA